MKPKIINVSFNNKASETTYPIFVGANLLSNCKEILEKFIKNKKIVLIHDNFFSFKNNDNLTFILFYRNY